MFTDYVEMRKQSEKLNSYVEQKHQLGSDTGIPTRWSVFWKSIKDRYLKIKKSLASLK